VTARQKGRLTNSSGQAVPEKILNLEEKNGIQVNDGFGNYGPFNGSFTLLCIFSRHLWPGLRAGVH
jgi:hypothetical protein